MKDLLKAIIKEEIARAMIEEKNWKDVAKNLALVASLAGGAAYGGHKLGQAVHGDPAVTAKASEINNIESLISAVKDIQVDEGTDAAMAIQRLRNAKSREEELQELQNAISGLGDIPSAQYGDDIKAVFRAVRKLPEFQLRQSR